MSMEYIHYESGKVCYAGADVEAVREEQESMDAASFLSDGCFDISSDEAMSIELSPALGVKMDVNLQVGIDTTEAYGNMLEKAKMVQTFNPTARHLKYWRILVDWMDGTGKTFGLGKTTIQVAVDYMDRILQRTAIERNRVQLVSLVCIIIASKYEETESNVPCIYRLSRHTCGQYSIPLINEMERLVLKGLEWRLSAVTPLHFVDYYIAKGVCFINDEFADKEKLSKIPKYVKKYCYFFADLALQEYKFRQFPSCILAAAIVAVSRRVLNIEPVWRQELEILTTFRYQDISQCMDTIQVHYETLFPDNSTNNSKTADSHASPKGVNELEV